MSAAAFWARTYPIGGHLIWTGRCDKDGYGLCNTKIKGRRKAAHRRAWEFTNGPIPIGAHCLHSCDTRPCVNPDHLFLGTNADNIQDAAKKGRWKNPNYPHACAKGHERSKENSYHNKHGIVCRVCRREKERRRHPPHPRTHCPNGHQYSAEEPPQGRGGARCRICQKAREERQDLRNQKRPRPRRQYLTDSRTHCRNGHPHSSENTYLDHRGSRHCRACKKANNRRWHLKHGY